MLAVGNILRITDAQTLLGQAMVNVYYYEVLEWTAPIDLTNILTGWIADVLPVILASQVAAVNHIQPRIDDMTDGVSFAVDSGVYPGTRAGLNLMPTYVAAAYRLNRATKITRPGQKRIGGLAEVDIENNDIDTSLSQFINVENILDADVLIDNPVGLDTLVSPVVVGRNPDGTLDLLRINVITSATLNPIVSTQVSRKPGR